MKSPVHAFCFGKVPAHGDFVRAKAGGRELQIFDTWIQEGMHRAERPSEAEWSDTFFASKPQSFIFPVPEENQFIAGTLWPSRDQSGRRFPFVVGWRLDASILDPESLLRLPLLLQGMEKGFSDIYHLVRSGMSAKDITPALAGLVFDPGSHGDAAHAEYRRFTTSTIQRTFWVKLFGDPHDLRRKIVWSNLFRLKNQMGSAQTSRGRVGIRFPMVAEEQMSGLQAVLWQDLCRRTWQQNLRETYLFWNSGPGNGPSSLQMHFKKPGPQQFYGLFSADRDEEVYVSIDSGVPPTRSDWEAAIPRQHQFAIMDDNLTFVQLFERLG